jgi:hypothetical protein
MMNEQILQVIKITAIWRNKWPSGSVLIGEIGVFHRRAPRKWQSRIHRGWMTARPLVNLNGV